MASLSSALKETDKARRYSGKKRRLLQGTGGGRAAKYPGAQDEERPRIALKNSSLTGWRR